MILFSSKLKLAPKFKFSVKYPFVSAIFWKKGNNFTLQI